MEDDEALIILWIREMRGMHLIIIVNATLSTLGQGWTSGERAHINEYERNGTQLTWVMGVNAICPTNGVVGGVGWSGVKEDTAQIRSMYLFFFCRVSVGWAELCSRECDATQTNFFFVWNESEKRNVFADQHRKKGKKKTTLPHFAASLTRSLALAQP